MLGKSTGNLLEKWPWNIDILKKVVNEILYIYSTKQADLKGLLIALDIVNIRPAGVPPNLLYQKSGLLIFCTVHRVGLCDGVT